MTDAHPAVRDLMSRTPDLRGALEILEAAGHPAHLVGGSVRDLLMGREVRDLDIATRATPDEVARLFGERGCKVHPTGIEHGTLTVVFGETPFEITTWRRDVATDGRRATVAFADAIEDDALRRDFTVNALYASRAGQIVDPTGQGLADAASGCIRFIGAPQDRIREDCLRILRFFRFSASHARQMEPGADLEACRALEQSVSSLPGERIGAEMLKLLAAPGAASALGAMATSKLLALVLPGLALDAQAVEVRITRLGAAENAHGLAPCPLRRLACLVEAAPQEALKLSRRQASDLEAILSAARSDMAPDELGYRAGAETGEDALLVRFARGCEVSASADLHAALRHGARQVFPLKAADLMPALSGAALGAELRRREAEWIADGFRADREALLAI